MVAAALLGALAILVAAAPAQAGKGWKLKETFGSANKPAFGDDRSLAFDGEGHLLIYDAQQVNERQQVTIVATAGQFKLQFKGETTSDLAFNASAATVQTALRALPTIGSPNVTVAGGPGDATGSTPYNVTFTGTFAGRDVETLLCQPGTAPLSGGAGCSVATTIEAVSPSVTRWSLDGTAAPFAALGTNRIDGRRGPGGKPCGEEAQSCDETPGNAGLGGNNSNQVAVDDSGTATDGNVYLGDDASDVVHTFSGAGTFLGQLTGVEGEACPAKSFTRIQGVAVDEEGDVYISGGIGGFAAIAKFAPAANPPANGDCVAEGSVGANLNIAAGAGPSAGSLFLVGGSSIEKRDTATDTYGTLRYQFGVRSTVSVEPLSGHVLNPSAKSVVEWDASGAEKAEEVSRLEDAGSTVRAVAGAKAVEDADRLYVSRDASQLIDVYEAVPIPEATIGPPEDISGATATATGAIDPAGVEVTDCFFEYGPTEAYGKEAECTEPVIGESGSDPIAVSAPLSELLANGATHHYRLVVKGVDGTDKSKDEAFETAETFRTEEPSGIGLQEATLEGVVKPEGVAIEACEFEWGETTEYGNKASCQPNVIDQTGEAEIAVSAPLAGLDPATVYHFRLTAKNKLGQIVSADRRFATQGAPGIEAQMAFELSETEATLQALLNPFNGETEYHFEWGPDTDPGYANQTEPQTLPAGSDPVVVSAEIAGLAAKSGYRFRLVAENEFGATEGPEHRFETLNSEGLPDNRAFELVTPADKGPAGNVVAGFASQSFPRPSTDGNSFLWPLQNGLPGTTAGGWLRMKANRVIDGGVPVGWQSTQVSGPSLVEPPESDGLEFVSPSLMRYASPDLRCGVLESFNPLTADTPHSSVELGIFNLYLWREEGDGAVSYELITNRLPANPLQKRANPLGSYYDSVAAAEDCSRVYFKPDPYRFLEGDVSRLYEWEAASGELRDAGVRGDGSLGLSLGEIGHAALGSPGGASWNAVSRDGRRMFFTALNAADRPAVFMREDGGPQGGGQTVEISATEPGAPAVANGARFEGASEDGSTVVFRANAGLDAGAAIGATPTNVQCGPLSGEVSNASPEAKACDLYSYDVASGQLTDISADANPEDPVGSATQGAVALDEDGSHVYFAALGQLTAGEGRSYAQNIAGGGRVNVYLHEAGGALTYVTNLGWAGASQFALMRFNGSWSAETDAEGDRLLYAATSRQNWYEGGGGAVAYLYDRDSGQIRCVSCRPDGEPTAILADGRVPPVVADSPRLLVNRVASISSLSDDGSRAFFISPDVLVAGAEAGRPNVYEWEDGQLYFLAVAERAGKAGALNELAYYRGISDDGSSAFLATIRKLAPQDRDAISDVYAVREDGGIPFSEPPPPCQVNENAALEPNQIYCAPPAAAQPSGAEPSSEGEAGEPPVRPNACARTARRAQRLARRAKAARRVARRAARSGNRRAARRTAVRARRLRRAARRGSQAARRCRIKVTRASAGGRR